MEKINTSDQRFHDGTEGGVQWGETKVTAAWLNSVQDSIIANEAGLVSAQGTLSGLTAGVPTMQANINNLQTDLAVAQSTIITLTSELTAAQTVIATHTTEIASLTAAIQEPVIAVPGISRDTDTETTLTGSDATVFTLAAPVHLPVYDSVGLYVNFTVKNIGNTDTTLDAVDGKTINGEVSIILIPGEIVRVGKSGLNWQTI